MFKEKLKFYGKRLLAILHVRPMVGGMEISDLVIRFVYFDDASWHFTGVRLPPGVMEEGKIKDFDQFVAALSELKKKAFPRESREKINAIVSLSSVNIYSQVFSLPVIEGENLEKAVQLNIQMVSPIDIAQSYSGWQAVGRDQGSLRLEILSAFIDKSTVDEINSALLAAGFLMIAMEPRALALSRALKEKGSGFDPAKSYIMVNIDNSGLDFLIMRRGQFYFEYFNPWRDIVDEKGQIPMPSFQAAVLRSLHQVVNFYGQHWPEPISEVVLAATALQDETEKIVVDNFSLPVRKLEFTTAESIGAEWTVALGCGLRGLKPRANDKEMSLLGIGAEEEFRSEQALNFTRFWRVLLPSALGVLLLVFFLSDIFLEQTKASLVAPTSYVLSPDQSDENRSLMADAAAFNKTVAFVKAVQDGSISQATMWDAFYAPAAANGVTVSHFSLPSQGSTITLTAQVASPSQVANFKKAIENSPKFQDVVLSLSDVQSTPDGMTSFKMTFTYNP